MNNDNEIQRYNPSERSNHWMVAILFVLAALSGLALFHPALFGLSGLFGGGTFAAAGGGGYQNTAIGQVIVLAYLDAYTKLVTELGGLPANAAAAAPQAK